MIFTYTPEPRVRYKIDLSAMMADCEANYQRLRRLLAGVDGDETCILLDGRDSSVVLRTREQTPYTSLIEMSVQESEPSPAWLAAPTLMIRLYHDARMAEVVSFEGFRTAQLRSDLSAALFHNDEKAQWNGFLAEWLRYCLRHGLAGQSVLI